jgi:glycosyltransferase involved in cell wall biosynthesis
MKHRQNSNQATIHVLLAAYQGEKFLSEQIKSIIKQKTNNAFSMKITMGTDPSNDRTREIADHYAGSHHAIEHKANANASGGALANFGKLMEMATKSDSEYFALADQDDYWYKDKLIKSFSRMAEIEKSSEKGMPILIFTDSQIVNEDMSLVAESFWKYEGLDPMACNNYKKVTFQNVGQGCTFLFNRELLEQALPLPKEARMHDHWLMLVASVFGITSYIEEPTLSYRQHSSNVVGSEGHSLFKTINRVIHKANTIKSAINASEAQAEAFFKRFNEKMNPEQRRFFQFVSNLNSLSVVQKRAFLLKNRIEMSTIDRTMGLYVFI